MSIASQEIMERLSTRERGRLEDAVKALEELVIAHGLRMATALFNDLVIEVREPSIMEEFRGGQLITAVRPLEVP